MVFQKRGSYKFQNTRFGIFVPPTILCFKGFWYSTKFFVKSKYYIRKNLYSIKIIIEINYSKL